MNKHRGKLRQNIAKKIKASIYGVLNMQKENLENVQHIED
jgi:hypothetical protein